MAASVRYVAPCQRKLIPLQTPLFISRAAHELPPIPKQQLLLLAALPLTEMGYKAQQEPQIRSRAQGG